jgi:hypothetical protein
MVDRIKPLKIEGPGSGGTETDEFPTSMDKNEDFVDARGYCVQNDTSNDEDVRVSRDASDNLTFQDGVVSGVKTLSDLLAGGMSPDTHRQLDQLVHELDEDYYEEHTYTGTKLTNVTDWTDATKTTKVREAQLTYTGRRLTGAVEIQYDASGVEVERLTSTVTYVGLSNRIANVSVVRS